MIFPRAAPVASPADQATIDQTLRQVARHHRRLAARLCRGRSPARAPTLRELRAGPLGRDLGRLAGVARGQRREPRTRVLATIEAVLAVLFRPATGADYGVPGAFWETDLGRLLGLAEERAVASAAAVGVPRPAHHRRRLAPHEP